MRRVAVALAVSSVALALLALGAPAWAAKVKICHVPPGNPGNFHTITVSDNAVQAHLGHGDLVGSCFEHCDQLCNDGNACTIDACDASEHCAATHPPVNCDDSNLCTVDSCDPANGCTSTPKVCMDGALCTVDTCDPVTGNCAFPPISCPAGQTCNPGNGSCEGHDPCAGVVCAQPANNCQGAVCSNGVCTIFNKPAGTPCLDPERPGAVCGSEGFCLLSY